MQLFILLHERGTHRGISYGTTVEFWFFLFVGPWDVWQIPIFHEKRDCVWKWAGWYNPDSTHPVLKMSRCHHSTATSNLQSTTLLLRSIRSYWSWSVGMKISSKLRWQTSRKRCLRNTRIACENIRPSRIAWFSRMGSGWAQGWCWKLWKICNLIFTDITACRYPAGGFSARTTPETYF